MISYLRGTLASLHPPRVVIDVNGVAYELEAPMSTFSSLPAVGSELKLLTHLVVREDAHNLYGFASEAERQLFRSLIKVSGVGARVALAILSGISVSGFITCVETEDAASLTRLPGIGKKTADRLIVEMRDRISQGALGMTGMTQTVAPAGGSQAQREAFDALVALGYRPAEASRMLKAVDAAGADTAELIRRALRGPGDHEDVA